ncbi:MAG: hypothetical protein WCL02_05630 [bacterium]
MADFASQMEKAIPSGTKSEIEVKFFVEKFFNRFTAFSGPKKTELLKRLVRCRDHA